MRYLISTILLMIVLLFSGLVAYCGYMAFTDGWHWGFVGLGILLPDVVAILALSAAIPAAKDY
jgi:TRAP-type C4-dicarboxylate transport system permease small subunit